MKPTSIELIATIIFGIAIVHTFVAGKFTHLSHKYPEGSMRENIFHILGEVEAVFGIWAAVFLGIYAYLNGFAIYDGEHHLIGGAVHYLESVNFTEPAFVFVIMCMAATRPVIILAENVINLAAKLIPLPGKMPFFISALVIGPLLGSFITEPAAMTVTAMILLEYFYKHQMSNKFKYATIGLLFVNVSIGGTLTHFAAPPVLMVAGKWHWDMSHMVINFGYKAAISIIICAVATAFYFRKELAGKLEVKPQQKEGVRPFYPTWWMTGMHIAFLALTVLTAHHMTFFLGLFLFFVGFTTVTSEYQDKLKIRDSMLVGFFLGGLVTLGGMQAWWLQQVITQLGDLALFIGATGLTAVTDNAALTYLGSLVELSDTAKYNLVAGAVAGGGLTVIANAPNPAGYGILKGAFTDESIEPLPLFLGALLPTLVCCLCFQLLP